MSLKNAPSRAPQGPKSAADLMMVIHKKEKIKQPKPVIEEINADATLDQKYGGDIKKAPRKLRKMLEYQDKYLERASTTADVLLSDANPNIAKWRKEIGITGEVLTALKKRVDDGRFDAKVWEARMFIYGYKKVKQPKTSKKFPGQDIFVPRQVSKKIDGKWQRVENMPDKDGNYTVRPMHFSTGFENNAKADMEKHVHFVKLVLKRMAAPLIRRAQFQAKLNSFKPKLNVSTPKAPTVPTKAPKGGKMPTDVLKGRLSTLPPALQAKLKAEYRKYFGDYDPTQGLPGEKGRLTETQIALLKRSGVLSSLNTPVVARVLSSKEPEFYKDLKKLQQFQQTNPEKLRTPRGLQAQALALKAADLVGQITIIGGRVAKAKQRLAAVLPSQRPALQRQIDADQRQLLAKRRQKEAYLARFRDFLYGRTSQAPQQKQKPTPKKKPKYDLSKVPALKVAEMYKDVINGNDELSKKLQDAFKKAKIVLAAPHDYPKKRVKEIRMALQQIGSTLPQLKKVKGDIRTTQRRLAALLPSQQNGPQGVKLKQRVAQLQKRQQKLRASYSTYEQRLFTFIQGGEVDDDADGLDGDW